MDSTQHKHTRFQAVAEEVFEPLQRYLRRRLGVEHAEDALSEAMLVIWRRIDDVPIDGALPWSYGVARRVIANSRRSEQRRFRLVERLESEPSLRSEPDPADSGPDAELAAALDELLPDDREVLRLWAWERLEPREIAVVLETTVNAATLRLSRARKRLVKILARQNSGEPGHESVNGTQEKHD